MRYRHNLLIWLVLPIAFLFGSGNVHACTCGEQTVIEQRENASAVFLGTVISKVRSNAVERDGVRVTFKVTRVWKGDVGREFVVYTGPTSDLYSFENLCAPPFKVGASYVVFATGKEKLETDVCAGTLLLAQAKATIQKLGSGKNVARVAKAKG